MGLGAKLVGETLPLAGTDYVEMSAVMAKYNPFAEKAGIRKVMTSTVDKQVAVLAEVLKGLGLEPSFFGCVDYVADKLGKMSGEEPGLVRSSFIKYKHPRFLKEFSSDVPFGRAADYEKCVKKASVEQLARLVRVCVVFCCRKRFTCTGGKRIEESSATKLSHPEWKGLARQ